MSVLIPQDLNKLLGEQAIQLDKLSGSVRDLLQALDLDRKRYVWMGISSGALVNQFQFWRGPCFLGAVIAYNQSAATGYLQAHNFTCAPPDTSPCTLPPLQVPQQTTQAFDFGEVGAFFSSGLYICASSTDVKKTLILTNDYFFFAQIRPA